MLSAYLLIAPSYKLTRLITLVYGMHSLIHGKNKISSTETTSKIGENFILTKNTRCMYRINYTFIDDISIAVC